ncbi:LysR family transcriptional regulator [Cognatishimia maritima]|uniref:DNA-binding transcriptional regulator, LysR family n=1 Tax=Cognatishimia maritima TaxID=870908 RepID=A0A1M5T4K0_9RHOB|nr:LysR family transcriptional regulator [Cognatishimia maritima]SHH45675.1 DNA-binding transcriptional regulator, LysR family [Cognatishimia maritima]
MNFATFDLNLLRVLDALLTEGSTVKAGEKLGLSQSAVSAALARLRHSLDDPLFIRQGNRLVATEFAENLRHPLRQELEQLEQILSPPKAFDPMTASGNFKISSSDFFAEMVMPQLGDMLYKKAPNITANLVDLVPYDYLDSLERYDADLAIIPDTELPEWINKRALFYSPFLVIARDTNPHVDSLATGDTMPLDLLCDLHHVLFSPEGKTSSIGDAALAKVGRRRRIAMTVPVFSGVCRVVAESDLIALIPSQLAFKVASEIGLKYFEPPMDLPAPLIVGVWHKRFDKAPLQSWVREQVFDLMRPLDPGLLPARHPA